MNCFGFIWIMLNILRNPVRPVSIDAFLMWIIEYCGQARKISMFFSGINLP